MATVTFGTLRLALASDLSTDTGFPLRADGLDHSPAISLTKTLYAGGNWRTSRRKGRQKTTKVTLGYLTDAQVAQLKAWQGELLLARFPDGELYFGDFADPDFNPHPGPVGTPTTLTFTETTYSIAV